MPNPHNVHNLRQNQSQSDKSEILSKVLLVREHNQCSNGNSELNKPYIEKIRPEEVADNDQQHIQMHRNLRHSRPRKRLA